MKYYFITVLVVALSLRLSAQTDTIQARQNISGQINTPTSGKNDKVHGKTKAGEEGKVTKASGTGNNVDQTRNSSASRQTANTKSSQPGKPVYTKKSTTNIGKQTGPSKNANNKNGSKTNSSTTTSGSGKKDM